VLIETQLAPGSKDPQIVRDGGGPALRSSRKSIAEARVVGRGRCALGCLGQSSTKERIVSVFALTSVARVSLVFRVAIVLWVALAAKGCQFSVRPGVPVLVAL
jgi:hypothetical protein